MLRGGALGPGWTIDPPSIDPEDELAVAVYQLTSDQFREYKSQERRKKQGAKGEEWENVTQITRVLDLTPVLLLLLTLSLQGEVKEPLRILEGVRALHRAMTDKGINLKPPELPADIKARHEEDPEWLRKTYRALGFLPYALDPEPDPEPDP